MTLLERQRQWIGRPLLIGRGRRSKGEEPSAQSPCPFSSSDYIVLGTNPRRPLPQNSALSDFETVIPFSRSIGPPV